jgi:hypothetical protein
MKYIYFSGDEIWRSENEKLIIWGLLNYVVITFHPSELLLAYVVLRNLCEYPLFLRNRNHGRLEH